MRYRRWHQLSFTPVVPYPVSQRICAALLKQVPFHHFIRFLEKRTSSHTAAVKTKTRLALVNTDHLVIRLVWLLDLFPIFFLTYCPEQARDLPLIQQAKQIPVLLFNMGTVPSLQTLRHKPLYIIKLKPKYSFPCSSLHFINGFICFAVLQIKCFKN